MQQWVFSDLPRGLGFEGTPVWWPLPVLGIAGIVIALAIDRLPGHGGHQPSDGLKSGPPTTPIELPGLLLASLASIGLGLVLGPEAPLIGLGTGLGILAVRLAKKDAPDQVLALMAAAAAFAAISSLFGSPVVGAVIIIEATGLGGPTLPVILLPGLLAAGIGSLVFIGMGSLTGLSSTAYAVAPLTLPPYHRPDVSALLWTVGLALVVALVIEAIMRIGKAVSSMASKRPLVIIPGAALLVAGLAVVFEEISGRSDLLVLFSGQDAMGSVVSQATTLSLGTLALLIAFKGLAWGISLGAGRGGPTFPAMFLGIVGGLLAAHLPGYAETPAVAALMGAATVSVLRLPLSSIIIALVVSQAGIDTGPLIILAVVVAYIAVTIFSGRHEAATLIADPAPDGPGPDGQPASTATKSV